VTAGLSWGSRLDDQNSRCCVHRNSVLLLASQRNWPALESVLRVPLRNLLPINSVVLDSVREVTWVLTLVIYYQGRTKV